MSAGGNRRPAGTDQRNVDPRRTNVFAFAQNGWLGFPTAKKFELPDDFADRIGKKG
jgi:hypothetical protein